ncbi:MAG: hypothetical protein KME26_01025 [Oscillatoria princeps RMCB-10]|nr:hypothetical protein [Oscillatoria princeps RMCB-10]
MLFRTLGQAFRPVLRDISVGQAFPQPVTVCPRERGVPLPPELAKFPSETFSHPYYWAAFTLIGTPW